MRYRIVTLTALCLCRAMAQTTLIDEHFANGLPADYQVQAGSYSVSGGVLTLSSGCIRIPGPNADKTFSRGQGLSVEADVTIKNVSIGDFNIWGLYDSIPFCPTGPNNGYYLGWYPQGSDNPQNLLHVVTNSNGQNLAAPNTTLAANQKHHVKAELLADGTINMYVDRTLIITARDNTYTNGFISLRTWQNVTIENLMVQNLAGGVQTGTIGVSTNLANSTFAIAGPVTFSGNGSSFQVTAPPGTYSITFGDVIGYATPPHQTMTLSAQSSIGFAGTYQISAPRTFLITFTGWGNSPPGCNLFLQRCETTAYPMNQLEGGQGMTMVLANLRAIPSVAGVTAQAFSFFSTENAQGPWRPPLDNSTHTLASQHMDAEAWLIANRIAPQDRLVIAGHSYGGNRARLFAWQVYTSPNFYRHPVDALVLVDPIDWDLCNSDESGFKGAVQGGCHQELIRENTPPGVLKAIVFRQQQDIILHGYNLTGGGTINNVLSLSHMDTDDAEIVHRTLINTLSQLPPLGSPPPFAVNLLFNRIAINPNDQSDGTGRFRVDLGVQNTGIFVASNFAVQSARLTTYDGVGNFIDGTTPEDPAVLGAPSFLCSSAIPTFYACPQGKSGGLSFRIARPLSYYGAASVVLKFTLVSNGVYFSRSIRVK